MNELVGTMASSAFQMKKITQAEIDARAHLDSRQFEARDPRRVRTVSDHLPGACQEVPGEGCVQRA